MQENNDFNAEDGINYLSPQSALFTQTEGGFLSLSLDGHKYESVALFRAFPFAEPELYISVRDSDPEGKNEEIGMIRSLSEFEEVRGILEFQLGLRYFTPRITSIKNIKNEFGHAFFDCITDLGPCKFTVNFREGDIVTLGETRVLIKDIDGNRFAIDDITKLTAGEMKKLDVYI